MAKADLLTGIVRLTEKQYNTLLANGYVTSGDKTIFYDENTVYVTPTNTGHTPTLQIVDTIVNSEDLKKVVKLSEEQFIELKLNGHITVGDEIIIYNPLDTIYITPEEDSDLSFKYVELNVPETATQGTLTQDNVNLLLANNDNYIIFNDEIYRLNDIKETQGYLTYSHIGEDSAHNFFIKCITITLSTLGWVLTTKEL